MKTLLYIEDNADNLKVLLMMLQRLRPADNILAARTAEEGINIATQKRPDLILIDINLPGINGYEALDILRSKNSTRNIPVIAVTAYAMQENIQQGMEAGFAAYITKPVYMHKLDQTLGMFLPASGMAQTG